MAALLGRVNGPKRIPEDNSDVQRKIATESAARAKLQRRVEELEGVLKHKDAEVAHHRTQRDALHAQVLDQRLPRRSISPQGALASPSAPTSEAPAADDEAARLHLLVGELSQQVVASASSGSSAIARAAQLQQDLDGARSVIEQLQQQLRRQQQQQRLRPSLALSSPRSDAATSRLEQKLQQCERERDQYAAACEQLRQNGAREASSSLQQAVAAPLGSHGLLHVSTTSTSSSTSSSTSACACCASTRGFFALCRRRGR